MTNKIILPYDIINYINKFIPMPIHPISELIKEYITMQNITNHEIITISWHGLVPPDYWRVSFYHYMIDLRYWQVHDSWNKKYHYFHTHPSFDYHFKCSFRRLNAYHTEMNAYYLLEGHA